MFFEDLSMRRSIIVRQHIKMAGFARQRRSRREVQFAFFCFVCKLAAPLVNGIKIKMHPIIVFVLVFELRVNIAFVN